MQKAKPVLVLLITTLFVITSSFPFASVAFAATCSGSGCNGLFATPTGCDVSVTSIKTIFPASARVDLRRSSTCSTFWAKTTNTDSLNRSFYANATFWYQNNGTKSYSVSSPGAIAKNQYVYTQQRYYSIANPPGLIACGKISTSAISGPLGTPCTTST